MFDGSIRRRPVGGCRAAGLGFFALAEVKRFNDWSTTAQGRPPPLIATARAAGAEGVALIPRNDGAGLGNGERQANLRIARASSSRC